MSIENQQANVQPKDIAEELLGKINWEVDGEKGYCTCPAEHLHNSKTGDRDCIVYLNGVATIFCQHQSCVEEVRACNRQLRKSIADGAPADPFAKAPSARDVKIKLKEAQRRERLELRARSSEDSILEKYRWTYQQIMEDSKDKPGADPSTHWREVLGLFKADDVVWMGERYDSGNAEHAHNFKTAELWLMGAGVPGPLTCPSVFKSTSISRNNDNVLHRRFLVVESDVHTKDDMGAIFKWLRDEVGLTLRAIVDTAGKSLHGWFDCPKKPVLDQLEIILPQLGCDAGLFKPAQPCRIPGALREGKYQTLVYLDKAAKARMPKLPSQVLPLPHLYYDDSAQCYWRENARGGYQKINDKSCEMELVAQGYHDEYEDEVGLSELQEAKRQIQKQHQIAYAGSFAGRNAGLYAIHENYVLVTDSPKIIVPKKGSWQTLERFFNGLLGTQVVYFYGWIKWAYQALESGHFTSGHALAIAGQPNCGKSLLQNLITVMLGGRVAKPYHFMTGKSNFNSECFGAEHLMIEDEGASTRFEDRRNFGAAIKNLTVNVTQTCYGKNKKAITLEPFWRLTMTMNEEPEDLAVLPPFDDGISEKLMLLKGEMNEVVADVNTDDKRDQLWKTLTGELPAFFAWLKEWNIPANLRASRLGIQTYHNPELLVKITELQPEQRLLSLIDDCIFKFREEEFEGTSVEVERRLKSELYELHREAEHLLRGNNSGGTYLGRLAKRVGGRVRGRLVNGHTVWTIQPPEGHAVRPPGGGWAHPVLNKNQQGGAGGAISLL